MITEGQKETLGKLLLLYNRQESDEADGKYTYHKNQVGFNSFDAPFLSKMAEQILDKKQLSINQYKAIEAALIKYHRQTENSTPIAFNIEIYDKTKPEQSPKKEQLQGKVEIFYDNHYEEFYWLVSIPYDPTKIAIIKSCQGRWYQPESKTWKVKFDDENGKILAKLGISIPDIPSRKKEFSAEPEKEMPNFLMPFQKEGVKRIQELNGRAILADQMGLGKTAQALAHLQINPNLRPALIIVPATLKINWGREIKKFLGNEKFTVLSGKTPYPFDGKNITIINYDILPQWIESLKEKGFQAIIVDECHYIKNKTAKRTKAVQEICKGVRSVLMLSGTPITNRPAEFYPALAIVKKNLFPSFFKFALRYCNAHNNGYGWDFNGASNTEELHKILTDSVMIRRTKNEVLRDLPPKQRSIIPLEITNRKEYQLAENNFEEWLESIGKDKSEIAKATTTEQLTQVEYLKQVATKGKFESIINWIEDALEQNGRLVVFATHQETIEKLHEHFKNISVKFYGKSTAEEKQDAVDKFQNDENIKLFIGNIKAAGVGITLTAASSCAFVELAWTPGEHDQAEDRIHRIGQEANSINCYYLIAENTIEEDIAELIDKKRRVLDSVLDGKEIADENSLLSELLTKIKNNRRKVA